MFLSTYTLRAVSEPEWIYFIFKTNNISAKTASHQSQVGKCRWCSATSKRKKWRKKYTERSCHLLDTVSVKQFYHSALHDVFSHKSTAVKIIIIFHFPLPNTFFPNIILSFPRQHDWFPSLSQSFFGKYPLFFCRPIITHQNRLKYMEHLKCTLITHWSPRNPWNHVVNRKRDLGRGN